MIPMYAPPRQTDRQTDGQTDRNAITNTAHSIAACCKNGNWENSRQPINSVDGIILSASLSCRSAGRKPSMPFRFAMLPRVFPVAISYWRRRRWCYYRSDDARICLCNVEIDVCRPIASDDDHEITCVRSCRHHVTGLDLRSAVIMPEMTHSGVVMSFNWTVLLTQLSRIQLNYLLWPGYRDFWPST